MASNAEGGRAQRVRRLVQILTAVLLLWTGCSGGEPPSSEAAAHQPADLQTVLRPIEGMSCTACAAKVKSGLGAVAGVTDVEVDLGARNARVTFVAAQVTPDSLVAVVNGLGYPATLPAPAK